MTSSGLKSSCVSLDIIPCEPPLDAYVLRVSGFPVPEVESKEVGKILDALTHASGLAEGLSSHIFLQGRDLQRAGVTHRFTDHARNWVPKMGLGVWPDRKPPTLWTAEQFADLGPGEAPPALIHNVFMVTASPTAAKSAWDTMLGSGTLVRVMTSGTAKQYLEETKKVLLPPITHRAFRSFPYYIPLLERKSVESTYHGCLENWLAGAAVYIRESFEDSGIVIIAAQSMAGVLKDLGGSPDLHESRWTIRG